MNDKNINLTAGNLFTLQTETNVQYIGVQEPHY